MWFFKNPDWEVHPYQPKKRKRCESPKAPGNRAKPADHPYQAQGTILTYSSRGGRRRRLMLVGNQPKSVIPRGTFPRLQKIAPNNSRHQQFMCCLSGNSEANKAMLGPLGLSLKPKRKTTPDPSRMFLFWCPDARLSCRKLRSCRRRATSCRSASRKQRWPARRSSCASHHWAKSWS